MTTELNNEELWDEGIGAQPPAMSDDALAAEFVRREGLRLRYVPAWGAWFRWSGMVWDKDELGFATERMRQICRLAAEGLMTAEARRIASERTIRSALKLAATDPLIAMDPGSWDAHPMLLNTPRGVVDLSDGTIRPHDPMLHLTQITAAEVGTSCPRWISFISEVTGGDRELQTYLQCLAGYCLTGTTGEQCFAFLHGHGANGKSVFLSTLVAVMGSYASTATLDTFSSSKTSRHLTELAGLRAARLVSVPETEANQGWAEARIKTVTGGERVRANFMHKDHFEFTPQFKLVIAGNHRPSLSGVGEAMRRRLHLVPFAVTIPRERRDPRLPELLLMERDGILGWMLGGCQIWQQKGLVLPKVIVDAVDEYFGSEDLVGQWLDEACDLGSRPIDFRRLA